MPCFHWLFTKRQMSIRTAEVRFFIYFFLCFDSESSRSFTITWNRILLLKQHLLFGLVISVRLCFFFSVWIFFFFFFLSLTENTLFLTLVCHLLFVTCFLLSDLYFCRRTLLILIFICLSFFSGVLRVFCGLFFSVFVLNYSYVFSV